MVRRKGGHTAGGWIARGTGERAVAGSHYSKSYFARENTDAKAIKLLGGWLPGCLAVGECE